MSLIDKYPGGRLQLEQTIDEAIFKQNWDAKQKIQEDDGWMLSAKMTHPQSLT